MTTDPRIRVVRGNDSAGEEVLRILDTSEVRLAVTEAPSFPQQLAAVTIADLLGRLLPHISHDVDSGTPTHRDLSPGDELLADRIERARGRGGLSSSVRPERRIAVAVGPVEGPADIHIDAAGWTTYLGTAPSQLAQTESTVAIGALAAACRGAAHAIAEVLAPAVQPPSTPESLYWSALTYRESSSPLPDEPSHESRLVDGVLVGGGSVGGAVAYALAATPGTHGHLVVTDPQRFESHNHDRSILVDHATAARSGYKVSLIAEALDHHSPGLEVDPEPVTLQDWIASQPPGPLPTLLVAVDSLEARRDIQDCLPLDVFNAACGPEEIAISVHRTGDGPCMCCLHMADVLDAERIRYRLVTRATGIPATTVIQMLESNQSLTAAHINQVERNLGLNSGSLGQYEGMTLDALYRAELRYAQTRVVVSDAAVDVAAPFVTALAGFLLAAEYLKRDANELGVRRLGPDGNATRYRENPYLMPTDLIDTALRWETSECLCRSTRRQRIIDQRYGTINA